MSIEATLSRPQITMLQEFVHAVAAKQGYLTTDEESAVWLTVLDKAGPALLPPPSTFYDSACSCSHGAPWRPRLARVGKSPLIRGDGSRKQPLAFARVLSPPGLSGGGQRLQHTPPQGNQPQLWMPLPDGEAEMTAPASFCLPASPGPVNSDTASRNPTMAFRMPPHPNVRFAPADVIDDDELDSLSDDDSSSTSGSSDSSSSSSSSSSSGYFSMPARSFSSALSNASYMSSGSESFVYCEDPTGFLGWDGYLGAVTRAVDTTDDTRTRFAAHFMAGPFAQMTRKQIKRQKKRRGSSGGHTTLEAGPMPPPPPMQRGYGFFGAGLRPGMGPPMPPSGAAYGPGLVPPPPRPPVRQFDPVWGTTPQRRMMPENVKVGGPPRSRMSVV
ncbi:uncharacterized protein B0I36DRAFT_351350 [Microdochium trichocladiopsis]|uniref:Uncharacterized protein n=1 Tax=Microdochium trichocladiopsis TaxID=1682393 RepID=A0A9P9BNW4_9PEZI|nr:uncharacterized protein B0I36DRAFT_351350 [Microdochium trichocladiopsis]KAH7027879.1 hypothetical protein B0I36DRAFT_351350 [Microdochium trichocladiopsis]